jgi:hypothetical protein
MPYESRLHKAIRKMIAQKMNISRAFVTHEGKMVYPVNGYLLTVEQILELDSRNELTSWGIRDLAKRVEEEQRTKQEALR